MAYITTPDHKFITIQAFTEPKPTPTCSPEHLRMLFFTSTTTQELESAAAKGVPSSTDVGRVNWNSLKV
jgi:hypothetical protein